MNIADKTFTVQKVADLLGISEFTVRRRIKEGKLKAEIGSKKHGYRVSLDSLMEYAKEQNLKIGSLWQQGAVIGGMASFGSRIANSVPMVPAMAVGALAGVGIGKALGRIIGLNRDLSEDDDKGNNVEIGELNDIVVLEKIIERLNVELEDYDLQIEYQEGKIKQSSLENEQNREEQEVLFRLKSEKFMVLKEIKNLEIRKAIIEQHNQKNNI